jgi:hypothetical protein
VDIDLPSHPLVNPAQRAVAEREDCVVAGKGSLDDESAKGELQG